MNDDVSRFPQTTNSVLMIRPAAFYSNPETARTNAFQAPEPDDATALAQAEFDGMVAALREHGARVVVVEEGVPVGIVSISDVVRELEIGRLVSG